MENLEKTRNQTDGLILYILSKGLRHIDELKQIIDQSENPIAKKTMSCLLVDYCMIHNIDEKDRSKLLNLGFKKQYLLPRK